MKNKKNFYNIIIASNSQASSWFFSISQKKLKYSLFAFVVAFFTLLLFLTDYLALNVDQWKLQALQQENKELQNKFYSIRNQIQGLESEVPSTQ